MSPQTGQRRSRPRLGLRRLTHGGLPVLLILAAPVITESRPVQGLPGDAGTDSASADKEKGQEARPEHSNTMKWSTASEVDNFGFDVYRSESEDGPFERITEEPVLGAGTTDEPSYYQYVDAEIDPTKDYYYYIESISMSGEREKFTPTQRARAKQPKPEANGVDPG